jgi:hypothetical protein
VLVDLVFFLEVELANWVLHFTLMKKEETGQQPVTFSPLMVKNSLFKCDFYWKFLF